MEQSSFQPGDVVRLKSGSPLMTVESVSDQAVKCIWFNEVRLDTVELAAHVLELAPAGEEDEEETRNPFPPPHRALSEFPSGPKPAEVKHLS